jgi:cobalamin 5'-phosphate synthase/cobalamin synthase
VITLVLGGVRSGKSEVAEALVGPSPATYLATALLDGQDQEFADRIARHQQRRPGEWATVEETRAVPQVLAHLQGPVLVDALGTWLANDLDGADVDALVEALRHRHGDTVVVSEEVGLGVHPPTEVGRRFADRLGEANRRVAEVADRCLLVVAGRVVELPSERKAPPIVPPAATTGGGFAGAVSFLTPLGGATAPDPRAFSWFPVAGALLGLTLGLWWWLAEELTGPLLAAALVVAADLVLTGALHFDGLVDSADGLLPHLSRERRLEVMAEPAVGAFGVAAGGAALLLRAAALAAFSGSRPLLLGALWSASRTAMAVTARRLPYARPGGLATAFLGDTGSWRLLVAGAVLALVLATLDSDAALAGLVAAALAAAGVAALARERLDGFTGDTLGAVGVVAETAGLVATAMVA